MYKLSKYNYFVESGERVIYMNGMTGDTFSVSKNEHENLMKLFEDLVMFHSHYNSLFNRFKDWGFIISEDLNEVDLLRFRNKQAVFQDKFYRLVINPTEDCVFNCWYCNQHTQNSGKMERTVVEKIKKHILYMIEEEKVTGINLDWFGGEPLMYFDEVIYPIAKFTLNLVKKHKLPFQHQATTNGYLITPEMVKKMKELNFKSLQITIDGDEKRHNTIRNVNGKPSFKRIMENISLLCEQIPDLRIILRLNYDEKTLLSGDLAKVFELIPSQYRSRIRPSFQRVWQTIKKRDRQDEYLDLKELYHAVSDLGYEPMVSNALQVGAMTRCYGDRFYHTVINYNGKVYKCTAHTNQEAGKLHDSGFIEWKPEVMSRLFSKATFENAQCLQCKFLPMCLGNCIHKMNSEKCALDFDDLSSDFFIKEYYNQKMNHIKKNFQKEKQLVE